MGLRHDQYRYDDVDRYSTNLNEQVPKARQLVQVYCQLVDFIKTGNKKPMQEFAQHPVLNRFDDHFRYYRLDLFLQQVGLSRKDREILLSSEGATVEKLYDSYFALETAKTNKKTIKVADGTNRPAIFNMRKGLTVLSQRFADSKDKAALPITVEELFAEVLAGTAKGPDKVLGARTQSRFQEFLQCYAELLGKYNHGGQLQAIARRCAETNRHDRMTGDGLLHVVDKLVSIWRHGRCEPDLLQNAIDALVQGQSSPTSTSDNRRSPKLHTSRRLTDLTNTLLTLVDGHKESI
jgi:hypothetical protein